MKTLRPWAKDGLMLASAALFLAAFGMIGSADLELLPYGTAGLFSILCIIVAGLCLLLCELKIK